MPAGRSNPGPASGISPGAVRTATLETASDADERRAGRERELSLVRRAQQGDVRAFEELYRANVRRVFAVCWRMTGDGTRAEELVQDVFVRAWEKLGSFRGDSAFSSWLHPLAVNVALTERRTKRRHDARVTAVEEPADYAEPHTPRPDAGIDLERAIATLPPGAREVFVLHDVEGLRHDEIAERMGVATGTSKAQLHRARRLLRERLDR